MKAARILRRSVLPVALICGALLYYNFGLLKVPLGMDTMEESFPPGSTCLIKKWPSRVAVGSVVFVDLPTGGTLLTRIARVDADGFWIEHENLKSRFAQGESLGRLPFTTVRGLVLTLFIP